MDEINNFSKLPDITNDSEALTRLLEWFFVSKGERYWGYLDDVSVKELDPGLDTYLKDYHSS